MTDADDDLEEYLDPELDAAVSDSGDENSGLWSRGTIIAGLHFLVSAVALSIALSAVRAEAYAQAGFYAVLAGLLFVAGVVIGRLSD